MHDTLIQYAAELGDVTLKLKMLYGAARLQIHVKRAQPFTDDHIIGGCWENWKPADVRREHGSFGRSMPDEGNAKLP
jgi:hypothetical protein